jgi:hypothetical protein
MSFLQMRTRSALKKNAHPRISIPYTQAHSFGIVFSVEDQQKLNLIQDLVNRLLRDGKAVSVLEFLPRKKDKHQFVFDALAIDDLGFWGTINSPPALQFLQNSFDYLFYVDCYTHPIPLHLLAQSKAKCRVGCYHANESSFFELMIDGDGSTKNLIENMYTYTRQLT